MKLNDLGWRLAVDLSDESLIENFRRTKDPSYFRTLVLRYQKRIYNAALRILGSTDEAEEVVQETYMKVHQNLDRFRSKASFPAWVFRITHNICFDVLRSRQRRRGFQLLPFDPLSIQQEDGFDEAGPVVSQVADSDPGPADQVDWSEQSQMIEASLKELPDLQRIVVVLHDIEGFSYQEIADIVGASLGTVRSRLHYGRTKLRQLLDPYFSCQNISPAPR